MPNQEDGPRRPRRRGRPNGGSRRGNGEPRRAPRQEDGRPQARKRDRRKKPERNPRKPVDLHIRIGMTDELCRLDPACWFKVLNNFMLGKEDIIIRMLRPNMETNVLLRGNDSCILTLREHNPEVKLVQAEVLLVREIRDSMLKAEGI